MNPILHYIRKYCDKLTTIWLYFPPSDYPITPLREITDENKKCECRYGNMFREISIRKYTLNGIYVKRNIGIWCTITQGRFINLFSEGSRG